MDINGEQEEEYQHHPPARHFRKNRSISHISPTYKRCTPQWAPTRARPCPYRWAGLGRMHTRERRRLGAATGWFASCFKTHLLIIRYVQRIYKPYAFQENSSGGIGIL
jgi:hypothetical protein